MRLTSNAWMPPLRRRIDAPRFYNLEKHAVGCRHYPLTAPPLNGLVHYVLSASTGRSAIATETFRIAAKAATAKPAINAKTIGQAP